MARILGIDIDEHTIRAVLIRQSLRKIEVARYLEARVPEVGAAPEPAEAPPPPVPGMPRPPTLDVMGGPVSSPPATIEDARRQALSDILAQLGAPPDRVIAGLDGTEASIRIVELPAIAAKKKRIAEVLPSEVDDLLPFDVDELVIDYQPIDPPQVGPMVRVMATAVPRSRVAARLAELKAEGVDPAELAVGAAALDGLIHVLPELTKAEGPQLILEVEHGNTEIAIIEGGVCTFARSVVGGLRELRTNRAPFEMALRRTLGGYRAAGGTTPSRAVLCGELAPFTGDTELAWLSEITGCPTEILLLPEAPGVTEPGQRARYGRAAALAARIAGKSKRLDLRIGEFAHQQAMGQIRQHARLLAICAATLLVAFGFATFARWSVLSSEQEALQEQLAEVTDELFDEPTRSASQARDLLNGGRRVEDPLPTYTAYDVLDTISGAIPTEITHNTRRLLIEVDDEKREGRFELQGTVASIAERDTIAANLENEDCFNEVEKGPTSPGPRNEGLNYRLEVSVQCPGDEPIVAANNSRRRRNRGR